MPPQAPQGAQWAAPGTRPYTGPGGPVGYPQPGAYPASAYPQQARQGGYPQWQQYPNPPKSNTAHILIGMLLVPVVVFILIVIVKLFSMNGGSEQNYTPPSPPPTVVNTTPGTDQTPGGDQNPNDNQTQQPGNYANDDYQMPQPDLNPPDLPMPQTYDEAADWAQANIFYDQDVPSPVRCDIPDIDPSKASQSEMQSFLNDVVQCLMRVWAPELQAAGFNAARPSVTIYSGQAQSPCGTLPRENAIYCSADQQIYYAMDLPALFPQYKDDPFVPVAILAHEFGHAIQAQTGILYGEAVWQQYYSDQDDQDSAYQVSRRTEMQADCFAGEFVNAVAQSAGISQQEQTVIASLFFSIGDDQLSGSTKEGDHGTGANRRSWITIGFTNSKAGACNTFGDDVDDSSVN